MESQTHLIESLKCPVCLDLTEDPTECQNCNQIFCRKCIYDHNSKLRDSSCPMCRTKSNFRKSVIIKRLLESMPVLCPNECGRMIPTSDLKSHKEKCKPLVLVCSICEFECKIENDFLQHLVNKHKENLLSTFNKNKSGDKISNIQILSQLQLPAIQSVYPPVTNRINSLKVFQRLENKLDVTNLSNLSVLSNSRNEVNRNKFPISPGRNGNYFCGQLRDFICGCCDDFCGPEKCCCSACMEFTCKKWKLTLGMMVNKNGSACQWTRCSFYCRGEYELLGSGAINSKRNLLCEYPNQPCDDCKKITDNIRFYSSLEEFRYFYL